MDNAYEDWIEDVIKKFLVEVLPPAQISTCSTPTDH